MAEHLNEIAAMRLNWMTSLSPEEQAAMGAERIAFAELDAAGNRAGGLRRRARGGIGGDGAEGRSEEQSQAGNSRGE